MKYLDIVEKLQASEENDGYIVMIKSGIFFIGVGKDAVILNDIVGLNNVCIKQNLCKVGFQIRSIEKYISKLKRLNKSFVIYDYNKYKQKEEEIVRFQGEKTFENRNCLECEKCKNRKETEAEIIERVKKNAEIKL